MSPCQPDDLLCRIHQFVVEQCQACEARPGGLTAAEAKLLADFLLSCHGDNPEYPCRREQPMDEEHREDLEDLESPASHPHPASCLQTEVGQRQPPEPLVSILCVLVKIGGISPDVAANLGEQLTPARTSPARRGEGKPPPYLFPLISGLLVEANLTRRQREIARSILLGATTAQVATELGIARPTVQTIWRQAREPLRRALVRIVLDRANRARVRQMAAIEQVFRDEAGRWGYRVPRHCAVGHERCAKLGFCPFAIPPWHLP